MVFKVNIAKIVKQWMNYLPSVNIHCLHVKLKYDFDHNVLVHSITKSHLK